jgi:methionyl-tRNA formyltransferase
MSNFYLVAGRQPWNLAHFQAKKRSLPDRWAFVATPEALAKSLAVEKPRYIFFLHWSYKVPAEVLDQHECVCFHMTDVPYGRGGSPLQNLIVRGHRETCLTALRMTEQFDAGPVYLKRALSLEGSSAEEIFVRASALSMELAAEIAANEPEPADQVGEAVNFKRRRPADSAFPEKAESLLDIHDFIRMLDADGYPKAFIEFGDFRLEFERSTFYHDRIRAEVTIRHKTKEEQ